LPETEEVSSSTPAQYDKQNYVIILAERILRSGSEIDVARARQFELREITAELRPVLVVNFPYGNRLGRLSAPNFFYDASKLG
jgi:hypothetical protein